VGRLIDFSNLNEVSSIVSAFSGLEMEDVSPKALEEGGINLQDQEVKPLGDES